MRRLLLTLLILVLVPASVGCVSSKKTKKEPSSKLDKYVLSEAPGGIKKLGVDFNGKITLLGYEMKANKAVKAGDKVGYTLYWKSNKDLGESGWKLYTHILDGKNKKILNIDAVGPLRKYKKGNQSLPPSSWKSGKVYADEQSFKVPKSAEGGKLKIVTGIWKGKNRLAIKGGPNVGKDRALVATLRVLGEPKRDPKVPELRVDRLPEGKTIKIDGKLDEEAWKTAASTGAFVNVKTGKRDKKASVQGNAKLTWDDTALYVGFEVEDKDVIGGFDKNAKDPHLWTKDTTEIMIDPDGDGDNKDYYEIQVSPQNLVFDSQFDEYNKPRGGPKGPFGHQDWSSKLESAVSVNGTLDKPGDEDKGYTVEIKLPWKSLDKAKKVPPELGQTWRFNFYAMQNNGGVAWSPILGKGNFHKASQFGKILFAEEDWEPPKVAGKKGVDTETLKEAAAKAGGSAAPKNSEEGPKAPAPRATAKPQAVTPPKPATAKPPDPAPKAPAPSQPAPAASSN